jgi:hypothetical protein
MTRWLALWLLAGCGAVDYAKAPEGQFQGTLFVMWVDETKKGLGDGTFVFVPSKDPLKFYRKREGATVAVIQPGMMYTDGGSIPTVAQAVKGFSPWGYAPAYMVHDWLFVARRCRNDPTATEAEKQAGEMPFPETADIAAEAIRTLIKENKVKDDDFAPAVISGIVAGPITRKLWDDPGPCGPDRIKKPHLDQIYRAFPELTDRATFRALGAGPKAEVVQVLTF